MYRMAKQIGVLIGVIGLSLGVLTLTRAQTSQRCFAETGFCITGRIRQVWEGGGGLTTFGYPLGPLQQAQVGGQSLQVQWFERQRIELHPANAAPYDVLLGRLGAERLAQQGQDWWQFPRSTPDPDCVYFADTGHNMCGAFSAAWHGHGLEFDGQRGSSAVESLALFGLPLSDAHSETVVGVPATVQWFERARFELRPDGQIVFGLLGTELTAGVAPGPEVTPIATATPLPTATDAPGNDEPAPTARPSAAPTRVPVPPTATRVLPTRTPVVPTHTAIPPTPTPIPPSPTPTRPPDLPPAGGLPSAERCSIDTELPDLTGTVRIAQPLCVFISEATEDTLGSVETITAADMIFTVTGPDGVVRERVTMYFADDPTEAIWLWTPRPGYPLGDYTITAQQDQGTTTLLVTGTVTVEDYPIATAPGTTLGAVTAIRDVTRVSQESVGANGPVYGAPGDPFAIVLAGFYPGEVIQLYLYGTPACEAGQESTVACYMRELTVVTADSNGHATYIFETTNEPEGSYQVVTRAEAAAALNPDDPEELREFGSLLGRINLDSTDQSTPPTNTPTPTATPTGTVTPAATATSEPTATPTATSLPAVDTTSAPTATPLPTEAAMPTPTSTSAPTATATATEAATPTETSVASFSTPLP